MKKKWGVILAAAALFGGLFSGCARQPDRVPAMNKSELKQVAADTLEDKYNAEFLPQDATEQGHGPDRDVTMMVTLENDAGDIVHVSMDLTGNNIKDDYLLLRARPLAEERAESLAEAVWAKAEGKAVLHAVPFDADLTEDAVLSDYFKEIGLIADWTFTVPETSAGQEENAARLIGQLYADGLYGRVTIQFSDRTVMIHGLKSAQPGPEDIAEAFS